MRNIYLNKNTKFQCQSGNAVWFSAQNGDLKTKISGAAIITNDCELKLIGLPRPGQCNLMLDPSTGAPSLCCPGILRGNWHGVSGLKVSNKNVLVSSSEISCARQGKIKPFKPTYKNIMVNDSTGNINVVFEEKNDSNNNSNKENGELSDDILLADGSDKNRQSDDEKKEEIVSESEEEIRKYSECDFSNCIKATDCRYIKESSKLKETNESKNAKDLKDNIGKDTFDLYAMDCGEIATTLFGSETYSIAHHHIIPVNQCFKEFPEIVKLANYFKYDINNAKNGICLPTMNQGYDKQELKLRLEIAFTAMEKLGKQWHKGGHAYSGKIGELEKIAREVDELFLNTKPIKDYKSSVNELLEQFRLKIESDNKCWEGHYEEERTVFCNTMDHICEKIALKLKMFESNPQKAHSFFVSKIALYFAYYNDLKDYEDILFDQEG